MAISQEQHQRLQDIKDEMKDLLSEAKQIIQQSGEPYVYERAKAYWIGHIDLALDHEGDYMSMKGESTFQETINALEPASEEDDEDEDEEGDSPVPSDEKMDELIKDFVKSVKDNDVAPMIPFDITDE